MESIRAGGSRGQPTNPTGANQFRTYQTKQQSFKLRNSVGLTPQQSVPVNHPATKTTMHSSNPSGSQFSADPFLAQPSVYGKRQPTISHTQKLIGPQSTSHSAQPKILANNMEKNMNVQQMLNLFQNRQLPGGSNPGSSMTYQSQYSSVMGDKRNNSQRRYFEIEKLLNQFNSDDRSQYMQNHHPSMPTQLNLLRFQGEQGMVPFQNGQQTFRRGASHHIGGGRYDRNPEGENPFGLPAKIIGQGLSGHCQTPQNRTLVLKGDQLFLVQNNMVQPAFILNQATNQLLVPSEHMGLIDMAKQKPGGPQVVFMDQNSLLRTFRGGLANTGQPPHPQAQKGGSMHKPMSGDGTQLPQASNRPKQTLDVLSSGNENQLVSPTVAQRVVDTESRSAASESSASDVLDEEDLEYGSEEEEDEDDSSESADVSYNGEKKLDTNPDKPASRKKAQRKKFPKLISSSEKFNMNLLRSRSAPNFISAPSPKVKLFSASPPRRQVARKMAPPSKYMFHLSVDFTAVCWERKQRFYRRIRGARREEKGSPIKMLSVHALLKKNSKKAGTKNKLALKGSFAGNPFKVIKNSKFIANTDKINHKLNSTVQHTLKKDNQAYGTYSINPFAYYPKHLKNTVQSLLQRHSHELDAGANLDRDKKYDLPFLTGQVLGNTEDTQRFEAAFVDFAQKQKDQSNGKAMDIKFVQNFEVNQKKRYMASTALNKSFHLRNVFDIWSRLHSSQKFDYIQQYLKQKLNSQVAKVQNSQNTYHSPASQFGPFQVEYYTACMKPLHRSFLLKIQQIVREVNAKYIHPVSDPKYFCYVHKKPGLPKKALTMGPKQTTDDLESPFPKTSTKMSKAKADAESDSNSVQEMLSASKNTSPIKDSLAEISIPQKGDEGEKPEKLSRKEQIQKLDDTKKRAFFRYKRWKFSLKNEKNINTINEQLPLLFHRHQLEYQICYTLNGNASGYLSDPKKKPPLSRVQSAKSGTLYFKNNPQMNTSTSKTLLLMQAEQRRINGSNFKSSRPTSKYKSKTEVFKVGGASEQKSGILQKNNSQNLLTKPSQKTCEPSSFGIVQNGQYYQFSNTTQAQDLMLREQRDGGSAAPLSPSAGQDQQSFVPFQPDQGENPHKIKIQDQNSSASACRNKSLSKTNKNFSEYVKAQAAAFDKRRVTSSEATYKHKGADAALVYSQLKSGETYLSKMTTSEMSKENRGSKKHIGSKKSNSRLKNGKVTADSRRDDPSEPYDIISHKLNQKFSDLDENVVMTEEAAGDTTLLPKIVHSNTQGSKRTDPQHMTFQAKPNPQCSTIKKQNGTKTQMESYLGDSASSKAAATEKRELPEASGAAKVAYPKFSKLFNDNEYCLQKYEYKDGVLKKEKRAEDPYKKMNSKKREQYQQFRHHYQNISEQENQLAQLVGQGVI